VTATPPPHPNKHLTNRAAFAHARSADPGFSLYAKLVTLELNLKDRNATHFGHRHDVFQMVRNEFQSAPNIAAIDTAVRALEAALSALHCSDLRAAPTSVRTNKYPDLRYLRHDTDFAAPATAASQLATALSSLQALILELKHGGLTWP